MSGIAFFYITQENQVLKVRQPNEDGFKPISNLANEEVIIVEIVYSTNNRKPVDTLFANFKRVTLDEKGVYKISEIDLINVANDLNIFSSNALDIAEAEGPLEIPQARFIPTNEQKNAFIQFIKDNYPALYQSVAFRIQEYCDLVSHRNDKKRMIIKEAAKLRRARLL